MRVFRVAALFVFLIGPAYAQQIMPNINLLQEGPTKTQDQIDQEQARDKAYKESLKKIPDAKTSSDPWGGVRSDGPKAAPAKTSAAPKAKAKAKTSSNNPN